MEGSAPNPSVQTAIDPSLLGVFADYGGVKRQDNFPAPQRGFQSSDPSAVTKSHMQSTNPPRDSRNAPARQSRLSDMFARLHHTSSSHMHDHALNSLRDSEFYLLDTPSRPSHSVVPHSMWTSSAINQKRYDSLVVGVQRSGVVSNYLESPVDPLNEQISEPPMYYFPDEDDVLAANNYGQLGIEYDKTAVAEMLAERRKTVRLETVGLGSIRTAVTITSASSHRSSRHSSPRANLLELQPQKLRTTPRIDCPEASSRHSSPRILVSQTTNQQPTSDTDHLRNPVDSILYNKESPTPVANNVSASCFDRVPTKDHTSKERKPTTVLMLNGGDVLGQYADVYHSMDSATPEEPKVKAIDKTKSTVTPEAEPAGNPPSKQTVTTASVGSNAKKLKEANDGFEEPAPRTIQYERQAHIPPQIMVLEIPSALAPPCDHASGKNKFCTTSLTISTRHRTNCQSSFNLNGRLKCGEAVELDYNRWNTGKTRGPSTNYPSQVRMPAESSRVLSGRRKSHAKEM